MKKKVIYSFIILVFAFAACDKQNITNKQVDNNALENFLTLNQKYQKLKNQTKDFRSVGTFKKMKTKALKGFKGDSVNDGTDDIWDNWESCAEITETENEDGSFTLVMDYGEEGCEEYGFLMKGKITMTWKIDESDYYFEEIYENYYMYDVTINGKVVFEGSWDENSWDDFSWSGQENLIFTFDDGEVMEMSGKYKEKGDVDSYTVLEGSYSYSSSLGYSFSYEVTKPLVYSYTCEDAYIPVEGTEKVKYVENGENEEFIMDYGDGTCDNKYTITSNGVTEEFDYDEEDWFGDDDGDYWIASDSTDISG
ncbi:MAG: hypothetical protein DRI95_04490 [Bacteroidetes bacterium]|nr:MAG: hypothetical protein DRI95_04490 [Bacteroidota bacterium]